MDVEITELEKIEADRVDGVGTPANGIPFLMLKSLPEPAAKDWAAWDAAHEGGGKARGTATTEDAKDRPRGQDEPDRPRRRVPS